MDALADFLVLQEATLSEDEAAARLETLRLDIRSRMADRIHPLPNLSPEQRDRMDLAADYTDQWYSVGEGDRRVAFRTWYVCGRKWGDRRCNTLTLSAHWQRRHGDPLDPLGRLGRELPAAREAPLEVLLEAASARGAAEQHDGA